MEFLSMLNIKALGLIIVILLVLISIIFTTFVFNNAYYMYHVKETVAFITDIEKENDFILFLPIGRYALTIISHEQHLHPQEIFSGKVFLNDNLVSTFHVDMKDIHTDRAIADSYMPKQPINLLYPETHSIPGYYHVEKIGVINVEDRNYCTVKITLDTQPENLLLKIETYMRK